MTAASADPRDARIAALEAENAWLRAELDRLQAEGKRKTKRAAYCARRNALMARGEWAPFVPAGPVRDHIRNVMSAAGMSRARFAGAAGVDEGTVSKILYEDHARVRAAVAAKIREVTTAAPIPDSGYVASSGASRRLQALAVAGWSVTLVAQRLGIDEGNARKIRDGDRVRVNAVTARQVAALYDELWNVPPPEGCTAEKIAASKARRFAARQGWVPAGAWDDGAIDDPDAQPAEGWRRPARLTGAELAEEARELFSFGLDRPQAAERLGVSLAALEKTLSRHPETAELGGAA